MSKYSLFSVIGIEIEYMLVDSDSLAIKSCSDQILHDLAAVASTANESSAKGLLPLGKQEHYLSENALQSDRYKKQTKRQKNQVIDGAQGKQVAINEIVLGDVVCSNELVMHVIELKNNGPQALKAPLAAQFQRAIINLQPFLKQYNLKLLPTGAHPWMDPAESRRWPHGNSEIYAKYDAIFNCQTHGFANLQSMHVNLPFANDAEFCQLHNSIRLLLPLLPALAASTPFIDGKKTGWRDSRLFFYGQNQKRIPSIIGDLIPDFICSEQQYWEKILLPMYRDLKPFDEEGILQHPWLNSRAAIPKFLDQAVEIRIIDTQECVQADLAIALSIAAILKHWQNNSEYYLANPYPTNSLKLLFQQTCKNGLSVNVQDQELFAQWQLSGGTRSCRRIWAELIEQVSHDLDNSSQCALETILSQGNLADRLVRACANNYSKKKLLECYQEVSNCLIKNELFCP